MSTVYIIGTPIGNLQDITLRALEVLGMVDLVICEDTRVTRRLLVRHRIEKPLTSFHAHSRGTKREEILRFLTGGKSVALVTDAGTPAISDPGASLLAEIRRRFKDKVRITPVPGPTAVAAALSVCGFPADSFVFAGFPPHKKGRSSFFQRLSEITATAVLYESPHRILRTLTDIAHIHPDRQCMVGRELTKQFETLYFGSIEEVCGELAREHVRGEFVVVLAPQAKPGRAERSRASHEKRRPGLA